MSTMTPKQDSTTDNVIDIVIPVYDGYEETRRCIDSVLASRSENKEVALELVLINDASPNPLICELLEGYRTTDGISVITNPNNLGFVGSANLGLKLHQTRDVVLLNSDTEVANNWLVRLRACAYGQSDIGTVTPFSNNATICSFPSIGTENELPVGVGLQELDWIFQKANPGLTIDLPTAVGFCMYIRRSCLDDVGYFDEHRFGRGYGEENDFSLRSKAKSWRNVLSADVFVYHKGSVSFKGERSVLAERAAQVLNDAYPEYAIEVASFLRSDPLADARRSVEIELARRKCLAGGSISDDAGKREGSDDPGNEATFRLTGKSLYAGASVQLHVVHDLGGGIARWCKDFCVGDTKRKNLVLKPLCQSTAGGEGLVLFADAECLAPIGLWQFVEPFQITADHHSEYARVVSQVIKTYNIQSIIVSSLIGHTLDILLTRLPTVYLAHDYFPLCPSINLNFVDVCTSCNNQKIDECYSLNRDFNAFPQFLPEHRHVVRGKLLEILSSAQVTVVTPGAATWRYLLQLFPELHDASWVAIPHGVDTDLSPLSTVRCIGESKLRIVVLGMLSISKGMLLLDSILESLSEFAEVYLIGTHEVGELFQDRPGVHIVTNYRLEDLQQICAEIAPDVGLLLSIWPETYSYTLTELMRMAIPIVATNLGSFAERIVHGETGFLVAPNKHDVLTQLRSLHADRGLLARIREKMAELPKRTVESMINDYHRLLPLASCQPLAADLPAGEGEEPLSLEQQIMIRGYQKARQMWKESNSLRLQLTMSREARPRKQDGPLHVLEGLRRTAERQREIAEHQRSIAEQQRLYAEHQLATAGQRFNLDRQHWLSRLNDATGILVVKEKTISDKDESISTLRTELVRKEEQLREVFNSTSWRVSYPLRAIGTVRRKLGLLYRCLLPALKNPHNWPDYAKRLHRAWKFGGLLQLKLTLLAMQADVDHQDAWKVYRQTFDQVVKPELLEELERMSEQPLISVIVPTYNTSKGMLRQMIESVQAQIYPRWELCIADDCSSAPYVKKILEEYAKKDARIKVSLGTENHGVSHCSNRALAMASGDFVVLLDHDDALEEQALLRVAQALVTQNADMIYSDEIMMSADMNTVLQYAYRPAFSLELLRSHPYIVHMVGFKTSLLKAIGGFDENLKISQDYDLILRAVEQATAITHIPEILYRWRIHGGSTGKQRMEQVMEVSKGVLQRHMGRSNISANVVDGPSFNLFDARYALMDGLRVAIIIPTKNMGDLVRQCIDSICMTTDSSLFDLVVIDHDSDDPASLAYFDSISDRVKLLRYSGPFNFSTINNWAAKQLKGRYSHYLLCNNDIEAIQPGWLERMLELGQRPEVGIVGARLLYPDRITIQHAGVCVGAFGAAEHYAKFLRVPDIHRYIGFSEIVVSNHEVSAVTAACLLIRKEAFEAVGGFDEALAVGFGDVDLCLRVGQLGYKVLYCAHADLLHHESLSRGKTTGIDPHPEDSALFQQRWQWLLEAGDPYFHPALNQNSTVWQMRNPMRCTSEIKFRTINPKTKPQLPLVK